MAEAIKTDEGKDYVSQHVVGAAAALGIDHRVCLPYRPDLKPFVERAIGTVSRDLFAFLPGFSGHSPADAAALRARKTFADRRGKSPAVTLEAGISPAKLQEELDRWCDDVYARRPHGGLDGASPWERATSWSGDIRRIADERALDALLAEAAGNGRRTVRKEGLHVGTRRYIAGPLGRLVGQKVRVRRDPTDLGRIHVYRYRDGPGWRDWDFVCVADDVKRPDVDVAEIAAEARAEARAEDRESRSWAGALVERYQPGASMERVLDAAAAEAEKVVALPRPGQAYETAALTEAGRAAEASAKKARSGGQAPRGNRTLAAARQLYLEEDE